MKEETHSYPLEWYCKSCGTCKHWNDSGGWCYLGYQGEDGCPYEKME